MAHNNDDKLFEELERAFDKIQSGELEVPAFGTEDVAPVGLPAADGATSDFPTPSTTEERDNTNTQILDQLKLIRLNLEALPDNLRDIFNL